MNLYLYISLGIARSSYFFSRRSHARNAKAPHTHLLVPTLISHGEIMAAWADLKLYGFDFTRLETANLLALRQKYQISRSMKRLEFARWLVEHGHLSENEVAR